MLDASAIRGTVDFGVLTIRHDEYSAVLDRLPGRRTARGRGYYEFADLPTTGTRTCRVAVVRCPEQGHGPAHDAARDMIDDFDPWWLLLVGIAGGVPDDDFTLGDVLLANRVYDFAVSAEAVVEGDPVREWNLGGGPVHREVEALLAAVPG